MSTTYQPSGTPSSLGFPVVPERNLYEYGCELLSFTARDASGGLLVFHLADRIEEEAVAIDRYLSVPTTEAEIDRLLGNQIPYRDFLVSSGFGYIVDMVDGWTETRAWAVDLSDIPDDYLPTPGVMLFLENSDASDGSA